MAAGQLMGDNLVPPNPRLLPVDAPLRHTAVRDEAKELRRYLEAYAPFDPTAFTPELRQRLASAASDLRTSERA